MNLTPAAAERRRRAAIGVHERLTGNSGGSANWLSDFCGAAVFVQARDHHSFRVTRGINIRRAPAPKPLPSKAIIGWGEPLMSAVKLFAYQIAAPVALLRGLACGLLRFPLRQSSFCPRIATC